ncbi:hypothetical protein M404DRAFT_996482 [Pisolithus tinctorius Marx 270]|uniref:Uncharacterized protein n=1 Tax=Pisolithus tinctorius Marx 270 TaxID=870435 RepID=A0A0C3PLL7_PISTI|nr:hypothetical protein M404DRAFT_996482 [Pisolithus tinctorius Marx 270]
MYAKYHLPRQRPPGPHTRHARTELQFGFGTLRPGRSHIPCGAARPTILQVATAP